MCSVSSIRIDGTGSRFGRLLFYQWPTSGTLYEQLLYHKLKGFGYIRRFSVRDRDESVVQPVQQWFRLVLSPTLPVLPSHSEGECSILFFKNPGTGSTLQ